MNEDFEDPEVVFEFTEEVQSVPEPGTLALLIVALSLLSCNARVTRIVRWKVQG